MQRQPQRHYSVALPTLRDYLLIDQSQVAVDHFQRQEAGTWAAAAAYDRLTALVPLVSIPVRLPLSEIYRDVF